MNEKLRLRRRAFVNGASVSAIRLQLLTRYNPSDSSEGFVVYGLVASEWRPFA